MIAPEPLPDLGDHYRVLRLIGSGGMGRVYLAEDVRHGRRVAVKVLGAGYASLVGAQRFLREIQIASRLVHPNIVPLFDSGEAGGTLYYVMPYIEGETLRQRLAREGMLPHDLAVGWGAEVADALAYAHGQGILHRDIKPENLLIHADRVMVADFGIARAMDAAAGDGFTSEQIVLGTRAYMSPEQATGSPNVDGRSDVYSLACVVYEMLVGETPFGGSNAQAVTAKKLAGRYSPVRVVRPTTPARLERVLAKALAPLAADRTGGAAEFARALRGTTARRPYRRLGLAALAVAGVALAAVAVMPRLEVGSESPVQRRRVVVGAFEDRTGDRDRPALGIMAADWVTEGLQQTGAVDVVPTPSALAATRVAERTGGSMDPVRVLARETGANLVVTGSIYRDRDSLILQAQLSDAVNGRVVGAVEPIRTTTEGYVDALQRLRDRLMGMLAISLDERVHGTERPPTFAAYEAFAQGMAAYVRSEDGAALAHFERAYQADTTFVLPLLYASFSRSNLGDFAGADSFLRVVAPHRNRLNQHDRDWMDFRVAQLAGRDIEALAAIRRAAEQAPTSKATYNFAVQAYETRQPFAAESAFRSLSPDVGAMRGWLPYWTVLGMTLHVQGKYREELEAGRQARNRFPGQLNAYRLETRAWAAMRRPDELDALWVQAHRVTRPSATETGGLALEAAAELVAHGDTAGGREWFARALEAYAPTEGEADTPERQWGRARARYHLGHWDEAAALAERLAAGDTTREEYVGLLGLASARAGQRARAEAALSRLAADHRPYLWGTAQFQAGRIAAVLGNAEAAARLLSAAYAQGYPYDIEFHRDRALAGLAGTPIMDRLDIRRE